MSRTSWRLLAVTMILTALGRIGFAQYNQLEYPRPCPTGCAPNVRNFGYFPTVWRQWPGENRQAQINPRSVGAEVLPTPTGQERLPLPRESALPEPPSPELDQHVLPPEHTAPAEPPAEPATILPPLEGGLPGLPVEPEKAIIPGPFETGPKTVPDAKPTTTPDAKDAKPDVDQKTPQVEPKADQPPKSKDESQKTGRANPDATFNSRKLETISARIEQSAARPSVGLQPAVALFVRGGEQSDSRPVPAYPLRAEPIAAEEPEHLPQQAKAASYAVTEPIPHLESLADNSELPKLALNGYCPVELISKGRWIPGDLRWTVVHDGQIFRLSGPEQRKRFLADPGAYAPAYSGNDPVLMVDQQRSVPGLAACCAVYQNRLYMFSGPFTQAQFNRDPQRYVTDR